MQRSKITYPELYFPTQISSLLEEFPILPPKPSLPQKPVIPSNPGEYDGNGNIGCWGIILIASVIVIIIFIMAEDVKFQELWQSILGFLCLLFLFISNLWDKKLHKEKQKEYEQAIKQHQIFVERYEKALSKYNEEMQIYISQKKVLLSECNIEKYRANRICDYLTNSYQAPIFEACNDSDIVKKGASEDFFVEKLKALTHWNVYTEQKVKVGTKFFYPDIIIHINDIYINVEIDEPYAGNDGTPIHFIEDNILMTSIDKRRNDYMTENGWVVIRFAEEQIFIHTKECIEYIAKVADSIVNGNGNIVVSEQFIREKWNKQQSYKMSYKRFRRTYVPKQYHLNIDKEDYRSYSDIRGDIFK